MPGNGAGKTRRDVLRTAAAVGVTGALAGLSGCSTVADSLPFGGGNDLKLVPEEADSVTFVDAGAILDDEATKRLVNAYIDHAEQSEYYEGPANFEELRQDFEDETDLPPSKVNYQVSFSRYGEVGVVGEYYGTIFDADWSTDEVVAAFEDSYGASYTEEEYEGYTIHVAESEWVDDLGVVEEGVYVNAPREVIEDVMDVDRGELDALSGSLKSGYEGTRSAPVRYAGKMPPSLDDQEEFQGPEGQTYSLEAFQDAEYTSGSVYADGDERGTETTIRAASTDDAKDIDDIMSGYIAVVRGQDGISTELEAILEETTVERDGKDVVLRYEATVDRLEELLDEAMADAGGGSSVETNVQAGATVQLTDEDRVKVTWTSNQNADHLEVRVAGCTTGSGRIDQVGGTYETTGSCASGETAQVTVTAVNEDQETIIVVREFEF